MERVRYRSLEQYFASYVIERYVDPGFGFSGLWSFVCYLFAKRRRDGN